ncbi:hypothetical protein Pelo_7867 [Pelomyxa schiedti]|nr:hypothetical protein Pelo_7867 [Pelomyxa schiedti]
MEKAPLWLIVLAQIISTVGDAFGQRVSRIVHKSSRRKLLISLTCMNCVQMFVFLSCCYWMVPAKYTGAVYVDGVEIMCYQEIDVEHKDMSCTPDTCHAVPCPPQGPATALVYSYYYPLILLGGFVNWAYYTGEIFLYREALGLLFLVLANLASSFLVNPIMYLFNLPVTSTIPASVYCLGIVGALLCTIEKVGVDFGACTRKLKVKLGFKDTSSQPSASTPLLHKEGEVDTASVKIQSDEESISLEKGEEVVGARHRTTATTTTTTSTTTTSTSQSTEESPVAPKSTTKPWKERLLSLFFATLRVMIPFFILSIAYAFWFCLQIIYNDTYHLNVFGFTTVDKVLLIFYVALYLFIVDTWPGFKQIFESPQYHNENYVTSVAHAWEENTTPWYNIFAVFFFRGFVNIRSFIYFYLAVLYDPNSTYLELTLVKIIFSWLGVVVVVLLVPRFIGTSPEERKRVFEPVGVTLKLIGTTLILISLFILNGIIVL